MLMRGIHGKLVLMQNLVDFSEGYHFSLRPMSLISSIYGTDDDEEILTALYTIANVSEVLIHNSNLSIDYRIK